MAIGGMVIRTQGVTYTISPNVPPHAKMQLIMERTVKGTTRSTVPRSSDMRFWIRPLGVVSKKLMGARSIPQTKSAHMIREALTPPRAIENALSTSMRPTADLNWWILGYSKSWQFQEAEAKNWGNTVNIQQRRRCVSGHRLWKTVRIQF